MTTPSIEERVAGLEGGYEHLATKADLAELEVRMLTALNRRIDRVFWAIIGIGGGLLAVAVAALVRTTL